MGFLSRLGLALAALPIPVAASSLQLASLDNLAKLSIEDLMDIDVVTVSRRAEPLQHSAAAVFVLDGDAIRRSGVRTLAEALRLVPGLQVARVDSHSWAVTARGFNGTLADKLEVLMDGRSLYTPLFSGVFWYTQDTLMRDIERIEVIRGPGAALWGANAVNGVVNIVTHAAQDTLGGVATLGGGGSYRGFAEARYGAELGSKGFYRVYGKSQWHQEQLDDEGRGIGDDWVHRQAGFRSDVKLSEQVSMTFQGDLYRGNLSVPGGTRKEYHRGENLVLRINQRLAEGASTDWQLIYDRSAFNNRVNFAEKRRLLDLELKHQRQIGDRQTLVLGGGVRLSHDAVGDENPVLTDFSPRKRRDESYDFFIQDQIDILAKRLRLTLGVKLERNDYSGEEVQPSVRASYKLAARETLWGALSRAVRIPNRLDHDVSFSDGVLLGDRRFHSEELLASEFGYRRQIYDRLSVDIAAFYNQYRELRGLSDDLSAPQSLPVRVDNVGRARSHGVELTSQWRARANVSVMASYRYFDLDTKAISGSRDRAIADADANDPNHQFKTRVDWDINDRFSLFVAARWVAGLADQDVGAYAAVDMNMIWRASQELELSLRLANLNESEHREFGGPVQIRRSVEAQLSWLF